MKEGQDQEVANMVSVLFNSLDMALREDNSDILPSTLLFCANRDVCMSDEKNVKKKKKEKGKTISRNLFP